MQTKCLIIKTKVDSILKCVGGGGPGFTGIQHIPTKVGDVILIPLAKEKAIPANKFEILAETKRKDPGACACCSRSINDYEGTENYPGIKHFNDMLYEVHEGGSFKGMNEGTAPGEYINKSDMEEVDYVENEIFC